MYFAQGDEEQAQRVIGAAAQPPQLCDLEFLLQAIALRNVRFHRTRLSVAGVISEGSARGGELAQATEEMPEPARNDAREAER
jgi:hypothetical protein